MSVTRDVAKNSNNNFLTQFDLKRQKKMSGHFFATFIQDEAAFRVQGRKPEFFITF